MSFRRLLGVLAAVAAVGCGAVPVEPPKALAGEWGRGPGACAAGFVIRFEADKVIAEGPDGPFTLLANVRYTPRDRDGRAGMTLRFALPSRQGGVSGAGGHGELDLVLTGGRLAAAGERYLDLRTGAARAPLQASAIADAMDLTPCGPAIFAAEARGRT